MISASNFEHLMERPSQRKDMYKNALSKQPLLPFLLISVGIMAFLKYIEKCILQLIPKIKRFPILPCNDEADGEQVNL